MAKRDLVSDVARRVDRLERIAASMLENMMASCTAVDKMARTLGWGSLISPSLEKALTGDFLMRALRHIATSPIGIAVARHSQVETLGYGAVSREWYVGCKEEGMIVSCWECMIFYTAMKEGQSKPKVYDVDLNWSEMAVKDMLICPPNLAVVGEGILRLTSEP